MDRKIGIGRLSANKVVVYTSIFTRFLKRWKYNLSFSDTDAYPFGEFLILENHKDVKRNFILGTQGTTHSSLFQIANISNQRFLGKDWWKDRKNLYLTKMFSSGRIWTKRKIIVMRDISPYPKDICYAAYQLAKCGIQDIYSYKLLYEYNSRIYECEISNYVNYR